MGAQSCIRCSFLLLTNMTIASPSVHAIVKVYGGVIAVRADNVEVNSVKDLKDKIIGAGAIVDLMAGQMQIYEVSRHTHRLQHLYCYHH